MDEKLEKFVISQIAFNNLWNKFKPLNGAEIAYIDAVVSYETDIESMNKNMPVLGIVLNNSNNYLGGKIDLPTDIFNEIIYHGTFYARYQDYSYNGTDFEISGIANKQKQYRNYKVTLSNIE